MALTKEDLIQEALENARRDRKTVEKVRDQIVQLVSDPTIQAESLSLIGISDNVAKLSDVLTKMNAQIVELTKVTAKAEKTDDKQSDKDSIFDEIEMSGTSDQTN